MYTFSSKLKTLSIILMILGILGIGYGFLTAPKDIADVEKILAAEEAHHEGAEAPEAKTEHEAEADHELPAVSHGEAALTHEEAVGAPAVHDSLKTETDSVASDSAHAGPARPAANPAVYSEENPSPKAKVGPVDEHAVHQKHLEHVLKQLQNKPWAALYVGCIFLMLISLGVLAFYAIQWVAQAGWSPVLFRVMEGITAYLPVGSVIFLVILVLCVMNLGHNHLFPWLEPGITVKGSANYDEMIAGKSGYLNATFWLIRAVIFLGGWNVYRYLSRKNGLAQDDANDTSNYKRNFKLSAGFMVFFIVSESIMAWDWIMSVDPHWFSTLFGWYVFASFFVSGITTIALVTFVLKSQGYLPFVNNSHIHDLAKFMFGISVFWTYLWFSQFMLIWYSNIPEEVTYFKMRIEHFTLPFWGAFALNFILPILILINSDFKRLTWIVVMAGIIILFGHYVDFYNMIMPATVGEHWFIGVAEIGSLFFFVGLFIFVVFTALTKVPLLAKGNPYIEESKHFHY
jgi:hypothetical protein